MGEWKDSGRPNKFSVHKISEENLSNKEPNCKGKEQCEFKRNRDNSDNCQEKLLFLFVLFP